MITIFFGSEPGAFSVIYLSARGLSWSPQSNVAGYYYQDYTQIKALRQPLCLTALLESLRLASCY